MNASKPDGQLSHDALAPTNSLQLNTAKLEEIKTDSPASMKQVRTEGKQKEPPSSKAIPSGRSVAMKGQFKFEHNPRAKLEILDHPNITLSSSMSFGEAEAAFQRSVLPYINIFN